jgi:hypothetical protein
MARVARLDEPLVGAGAADRDVDVRAQVAVLHVAVAGAEIAQDLAQLGDIGRGLLRPPDVGARDDLHQRHAGAVEVHEGHRRVHVVDRLAGVLFQMDALDPHAAGDARTHVHDHLALAHDGVVELADLVALRQVGVEVVLPVEGGPEVDLRLQAEARAHRLFHAEFVDDRQHPRHRRVHEGDVRIGFRPEGRRGAREELGLARHLGVDLHADHELPVVGAPAMTLGFGAS